MKILDPALRQYRHNISDEFVFGYDKEETKKIVGKLLGQIEYLIAYNKQVQEVTEHWLNKYEAQLMQSEKW